MKFMLKLRVWDNIEHQMIYDAEYGVYSSYSEIVSLGDMNHSSRYVLNPYTGFNDIKGKPIYVDDLVFFSIDGDSFVRRVVFNKGRGAFMIDCMPLGKGMLCNYKDSLEIVGNIYENGANLGRKPIV